MLSQNVARATVPSYYMIRTNLPHRKAQNQWEGVLYFSGITKRQQHLILMQRKRVGQDHIRAFSSRLEHLHGRLAAHQRTSSLSSTSSHTQTLQLACALAQCGMHAEASNCMQEIIHGQRHVRVEEYVSYLDAMTAEQLHERILFTDAGGDPTLTYKFMGSSSGDERAAEAYRIFDVAMNALEVEMAEAKTNPTCASGTAAASLLVNALMRVLLTCGYAHVKAIAHSVYDTMGHRGIAPTITTYELVMKALALMGDLESAEGIMSFLQQHHAEHISVEAYNALLMGHRESKSFDRCDVLWQELVDRRWPRANPLSAELYLRSIIDHSYTPMSAPMQRFGNINIAEQKKIPMILAQLDDLGIPRTHLSRSLLDEVESALRRFSIHRSRFYEWGRAVKQFDFVEFRRRQGWMYDVDLMKNTTKSLPPMRDPTQPDATQAAIATAEVPEFFSERQRWERPALGHVLFVSEQKERTDDVRAGDIYYDENRSIHERSPTWMNEVPETRYDQLYGISNPDISKVGIRQHLDVEYTNRGEVLERDAALMKRSLTHGRRLRHRIDNATSHRNEGSLSKKKMKE